MQLASISSLQTAQIVAVISLLPGHLVVAVVSAVTSTLITVTAWWLFIRNVKLQDERLRQLENRVEEQNDREIKELKRRAQGEADARRELAKHVNSECASRRDFIQIREDLHDMDAKVDRVSEVVPLIRLIASHMNISIGGKQHGE